MFSDEQEPTIEEFRANTIFRLYKVFSFDQGTMNMQSILALNISFASVLEKYGMDKMTGGEYEECLQHLAQMNEHANSEEFNRAEDEAKIVAANVINILEKDELNILNNLLDDFEEEDDQDYSGN